MPDGTEFKHLDLAEGQRAKTALLKKPLYPCFFYNIILSGPTSEERMAPYRDLLDNTANLQPVVSVLKGISMKDGTTGYDAVLRTLINFNPNMSWRSQERLFACRMKNDFLFNRIFLVRTVHILWMEKNGQLPWSIRTYSVDEIRGLFFEFITSLTGPMRPTLPPQSLFANGWEDFTEETIPYEASFKLHAIAMKLKAATREQSAINCIRFLKSNFFHPYESGGESWMLDRYVGGVPWGTSGMAFCPRTLNRLFEERIAGCHSPTILLSELLRLLNIPALPVKFGGHGVTYIPGLERFVHGDHVVDFSLYPTIVMMLTSSEMAEYKTDSMMFETLYRKIGTVLAEPYHQIVENYRIRRTGTTLAISFAGLTITPPADVLAMLQQEVPQFNLRIPDSGTGLTAQPVPIRTLGDFSAPGSDLWH